LLTSALPSATSPSASTARRRPKRHPPARILLPLARIGEAESLEFSCTWCNELLASASELLEHERGHGPLSSWLPLLPFGCGACGQAFATLAELETHQAAEEENDDDSSPGGFADAACSFCFEEFAMVSQAQACERAHVAAVPTGSEQEEERQEGEEEEEEEEEVEEDEDL
jgi:hypothetical protein